MTATKILGRSGAFFAGILLGFSGVTPAFAATLDAAQLTPSQPHSAGLFDPARHRACAESDDTAAHA